MINCKFTSYFLFIILFLTSASLLAVQDNLKQLTQKRQQELYDANILPRQTQLYSTFLPNIYVNKFNPSIGVILNGTYSNFSNENSDILGFGVGEEGERPTAGFAVGEVELNFSANIDDKFFGSLTAAIVHEDGVDKVELEEAFVQTTPGFGLPVGMSVKAGRSFWRLGYLNEHHAHADDFADRPLPYKVFFNKSYNDDGMEISYVFPTDLLIEIGGGSFRGEDFPFSNTKEVTAYSSYIRLGSDIGDNQSWRLGGYMLVGSAEDGRVTDENNVTFIGDTKLYIVDMRYILAPTGNARNQEIIVQGEYFYRSENGSYEVTGVATGQVNFDSNASGWYFQSIYKFKPQWRVGLRYSALRPADVLSGSFVGSALDAREHKPQNYSFMFDWTNSEFSRLRLQYNYAQLSYNQNDNQVMLQYVMSFGAHGAHQY